MDRAVHRASTLRARRMRFTASDVRLLRGAARNGSAPDPSHAPCHRAERWRPVARLRGAASLGRINRVGVNIDQLTTPIGEIAVVVDDEGRLRAVVFAQNNPRQAHWLAADLVAKKNPAGREELARYFAGDLAALGEITVRTDGTAFQELVWRALRAIPAGETRTYAELAASIGRPDAARAVGHANGKNPLNIVVPCHRLIGSNGKLVAYGGGLARKEYGSSTRLPGRATAGGAGDAPTPFTVMIATSDPAPNETIAGPGRSMGAVCGCPRPASITASSWITFAHVAALKQVWPLKVLGDDRLRSSTPITTPSMPLGIVVRRNRSSRGAGRRSAARSGCATDRRH